MSSPCAPNPRVDCPHCKRSYAGVRLKRGGYMVRSHKAPGQNQGGDECPGVDAMASVNMRGLR
jgi:hypothetical protein